MPDEDPRPSAAHAQDPTQLRPGSAVPDPQAHPSVRFETQGTLGKGGMSEVRLVWDTVLERHIAVKVLSTDHPQARVNFLREARITAQLEHPNIIPVHDYLIADDDQIHLHLKRVAGQSLAARIVELRSARLGPERLDELLTALLKVCDAVSYAHSRGILHRDIKPANVLLGEFGEVYLVDWGIAVRADSGGADDLSGTPAYMAPEQIDPTGHPPDARTDVYGLGGLLYAILAGRPPHPGENTVAALSAGLNGEITPPKYGPPGLGRIAMKALSLAPADRYASALAFKAELEGFRRGAWHLPTLNVAAGTALVVEGEPGDEAFVIVRGRCQVRTAARGVVRELGPGDVFGELAVLGNRPRSSTVMALEDTLVQIVNRADLTSGVGLDTWTGAFVATLVSRFAELEGLLAAATAPKSRP